MLVRKTAEDKEFRFPDIQGVSDSPSRTTAVARLQCHAEAAQAGGRAAGPGPGGRLGRAGEPGQRRQDRVRRRHKVRVLRAGGQRPGPPQDRPAADRAWDDDPGPGPAPRRRDLVLRDLATGKELTLGNVAEFGFDKKGTRLAMCSTPPADCGNGVQMRDMKTATLHQLETGKRILAGCPWTETGDAFSLLKREEETGKTEKKVTMLACTDPASPTLAANDPAAAPPSPRAWRSTDPPSHVLRRPRHRLFQCLGEEQDGPDCRPALPKGKGKGKGKGRNRQDAGRARGDAGRPPGQARTGHLALERLRASSRSSRSRPTIDRQFSYLCVYRVKEKKFVRLADDTCRKASLAPKQRYAIGLDAKPYERMSYLDGKRYTDVYVIDMKTGERQAGPKKARYVFGAVARRHALPLLRRRPLLTSTTCPRRRAARSPEGVGASFMDTEDDHNL